MKRRRGRKKRRPKFRAPMGTHEHGARPDFLLEHRELEYLRDPSPERAAKLDAARRRDAG